MVLAGRVVVNGKVVKRLPVLVDPAHDRIEIDGERIRLPGGRGAGGGKQAARGTEAESRGQRLYLLMNKPKGVYTTNVAQGEQIRAIDLLPPNLPGRVYPVGRLDSETRGLLLLTNDGELTNQLTHPRYGVAKTYRATVDGLVGAGAVQELEQGIWVADPKTGKGVKTGRSQVRVIRPGRERSVLEITTREGRNQQVRRMLAKLGHKVRDLIRVRMGPLTLHGLAPGQVRSLTPKEVRELRSLPNQRASVEGSRPIDRAARLPRTRQGAVAPPISEDWES